MNLLTEIHRAEGRIRPHILETPLEPAPAFSQASGAEVLVKCDHLQRTGSFKLRGAFNRILAEQERNPAANFLAASTGNHGAGIAYALAKTGMSGRILIPSSTVASKRANIERLGGIVESAGQDGGETEIIARQRAKAEGAVFVSPYNDLEVVAGQGTIGVEIARQSPAPLDAIFVAVGGGGLAAGIATYLKSVWPEVNITGCSPSNSPVMAESIKAGKVIDYPDQPTLSDGTAGSLEPDCLTLPLCRDLIDDWVFVDEDEIAAALRLFVETHHQIIEGAAAVPLAAIQKQGKTLKGKRVTAILCGANIDLTKLSKLIQ